jgi:hypothetical protein
VRVGDKLLVAALWIMAAGGGLTPAMSFAAEPARSPAVGVEHFDADPGWDGFRNRLLPDKLPVVVQDFGYRGSNRAQGKRPGEVGGTITRTTTPAGYARPIADATLDDRLSVSGTFAVTAANSSSGMLFGWFHDTSRGWRTPNSLALRIDGNGAKYWIFFEYGTRNYKTGGGVAFEGEQYQTTKTRPFPADGTPHRFQLTYDPRPDGTAVLRLVLDGHDWKPVEVPKEHRADGATFNRFGIWNVQIAGEPLEVYFDDLVVNGVAEGFDRDPHWKGAGNTAHFEDRVIRPFHDFGFSRTQAAGGAPGELAGIMFRDEKPAYYGRAVRPLTLDDSFEASGRLAFLEGSADSGVCLGWFDAKSKRSNDVPQHVRAQPNTLAIVIEGPSRVGHYFRPAYTTGRRQGRSNDPDSARRFEPPVIRPDGKPHTWSIAYRPRPDGSGRVRVTLDEQEQTLDVSREHRRQNARYDRFGLFNMQAGGHYVRLAIDDLRLTDR